MREVPYYCIDDTRFGSMACERKSLRFGDQGIRFMDGVGQKPCSEAVCSGVGGRSLHLPSLKHSKRSRSMMASNRTCCYA